jgi:hypothetical protein
LVYFRSVGTTKWVVYLKLTLNVHPLINPCGRVSRPRHTMLLRSAYLDSVTKGPQVGSGCHHCHAGMGILLYMIECSSPHCDIYSQLAFFQAGVGIWAGVTLFQAERFSSAGPKTGLATAVRFLHLFFFESVIDQSFRYPIFSSG